jgi:hypothetical protein
LLADMRIQFTWDLFLRIAQVHILLVNIDIILGGYLDLHPNDQKTRFLPSSIRSIILASERNRKLKYDADNKSDVTTVLIFALQFQVMVVPKFIETMELLHLQGPKNNV